MTAEEALRDVKRAASAGQVMLTAHARERMRDRSATARDVERAIRTSTTAVKRSLAEEKWRLSGGVDLDGDALDVVVACDSGGWNWNVVTVY